MSETNSKSPAHSELLAAARILDANGNRFVEALRVIEDQARYRLDDPHLVDQLKRARHEFVAALESAVPIPLRLAARDTLADVGTDLSTSREMRRSSLDQILTAGFSRAQEAARSVEEHLKLFNAEASASVEHIRYQLYTLQKAMQSSADSQTALSGVQVYALVGGHESLEDFEAQVERLVFAQVDAIQIREKRLNDRELIARGKRLVDLTCEAGVLSVINDRADIAALCNSDAVHLGQDDISVSQARRIVGEKTLIGVSTHSLEQAQRAVLDGADYIGVGPTFPSETKKFDAFPGLQNLSQVSQSISLPSFAIGGITLENVQSVVDAGARRLALSGAVGQTVPDLPTVVADFRQALIDAPALSRC